MRTPFQSIKNTFLFTKSITIFLLIYLLILPISYAQQQEYYLDVHPVRVNHKWGYVKIYPTKVKMLVEPKYDFLGDINMPYNTIANNGSTSPYKLFDLDGKVGLLNNNLEEVISNQYKQIKVVSDDFFAVSTANQFCLLDQQGKIYFDSIRFENISLADGGVLGAPSYFYTRKKGLWGISRIPKDEEVVPSRYRFIEKAGHPGYYKVQSKLDFSEKKKQLSDNLWGLIDTTNRQVLPIEYRNIIVLDERHYAVQQDQIWSVLIRRAGNIFPKKNTYEYIEKINSQIALFVPSTGLDAELWNFRKDTLLHTFRDLSHENYELCKPLNDQYAIKYGGRGFYLINLMGKKVSDTFYAISPTEQEKIHIVRGSGGFGLFEQLAQDTFRSSGYHYDAIVSLHNNLAIVKKGGKYGMLGIAQDSFASLPCDYTAVPQINGDTILLEFGTNTFSYTFTPTSSFVANPIIYENTGLMSENPEYKLREAATVKFKRHKAYRPPLVDYQVLEDTIYTRDSIRDTWGRRVEIKRALVPIDTMNRLKRHIEILSNYYAIHFDSMRPVKKGYLSYITKGKARPFLLKDLVTGEAKPVPKMFGLRHFNEESSVSVFIDTTGQMGIIDKEGQELTSNGQPIRYTYIGPFIAGRARVCTGGSIVFDPKKDLALPPKFAMGNMTQLLYEFRIRPKEYPKDKQGHTPYYIKSLPDSPIKWSYIDTKGQVLIETDYEYVEDFHWRDSCALVLKTIDKEVYIGTGKKEAVYGLLDFLGNTKIEPAYDKIVNYEGFYFVSQRGTPTFTFNQKGQEILINPTKPSAFSEGMAQVRSPQRLTGYMDETGKMLVAPKYKFARAFTGGRALVADTTGTYQFIDKKGQVAFSMESKNPLFISDFKEGYSWIKKAGKSWFWKCITTTGELAFKRTSYYKLSTTAQSDSSYFVPMSFSNGLATVRIIDTISSQLVSAIIDTTGRLVHQFTRQVEIGAFNKKGRAIFKETSGQGLLDSLGDIKVTPIYKNILALDEHRWKVQTNKGLWGLISDEGSIIIAPTYSAISNLSEDLVAIKENNYSGWSYANQQGKIVLPGPYSTTTPFKNGYATVGQNKEEFIINKVGERLSFEKGQTLFFSEGLFGVEKNKPKERYYVDATGGNVFGRFFQEIMPFQLGIAKVKRLQGTSNRKELFGAINKRGVMIVPPKFSYLHIQADGNIIINPQRYFGILDKAGKVLIEPTYDKIEKFEAFDIFRVERGESVGYIRLVDGESTWIWDLQK